MKVLKFHLHSFLRNDVQIKAFSDMKKMFTGYLYPCFKEVQNRVFSCLLHLTNQYHKAFAP